MQVSQILTEIDLEIARLQRARSLLAGKAPTSRPAKAAGKAKSAGQRKLTAEGRRKISEAMTRRWAERRKQSAKAARGTKQAAK